ncbi:MAG: hypothetical protein QOE50_761 [Sphingomonadales bacterium]|nr:hypothetical protein [Sphingomonadales bacterium]
MLKDEVPPHTDPDDANPEDVSWLLDEGLRSCRTVVSNYRALLADGESGQAGSTDADALSHLQPEEMVDALGLEPRTR